MEGLTKLSKLKMNISGVQSVTYSITNVACLTAHRHQDRMERMSAFRWVEEIEEENNG